MTCRKHEAAGQPPKPVYWVIAFTVQTIGSVRSASPRRIVRPHPPLCRAAPVVAQAGDLHRAGRTALRSVAAERSRRAACWCQIAARHQPTMRGFHGTRAAGRRCSSPITRDTAWLSPRPSAPQPSGWRTESFVALALMTVLIGGIAVRTAVALQRGQLLQPTGTGPSTLGHRTRGGRRGSPAMTDQFVISTERTTHD